MAPTNVLFKVLGTIPRKNPVQPSFWNGLLHASLLMRIYVNWTPSQCKLEDGNQVIYSICMAFITHSLFYMFFGIQDPTNYELLKPLIGWKHQGSVKDRHLEITCTVLHYIAIWTQDFKNFNYLETYKYHCFFVQNFCSRSFCFCSMQPGLPQYLLPVFVIILALYMSQPRKKQYYIFSNLGNAVYL